MDREPGLGFSSIKHSHVIMVAPLAAGMPEYFNNNRTFQM